MGKLRKYTRLLPNDWKAIDEIAKLLDENHFEIQQDSCRPSSNAIANKDINLIRFHRQGRGRMFRNFCKCGYVSNEEALVECPICGNKNILDVNPWENFYKKRLLTFRMLRLDTSTNEIEGYTSSFVIEEVGEELCFTYSPFIKTTTVKENEALGDWDNYSFEKILELYPYKKDTFKYFKTRGYSSHTRLEHYFEALKTYPTLMDSLEKYPNLISAAILCPYSGMDESSTIEDVFSKGLLCNDKKFYPYLYQMLERTKPTDFESYSCRNKFNIFNGFDTFTKDLKESIFYLIGHTKITGVAIGNIINSICYKSYDETKQNYLAKFILANFVKEGENVVSAFADRIYYLTSKGFEVTEDTIDTKNFLSIKHSIQLKTYYNESRASLFMDAFDLNPLDSLKFLTSNKTPTKEEIEEINEKMDKKYSS